MMETDDLLRELLCRLLWPPKPKPQGVVQWQLEIGTFAISFRGDWIMQLPDDKTVSATVAYVDAKGHPAAVAGMTPLVTLGTVEVIAGSAVAGTISFGEPQ